MGVSLWRRRWLRGGLVVCLSVCSMALAVERALLVPVADLTANAGPLPDGHRPAHRWRPARLNLAVLGAKSVGPGDTLRLELFADAAYTARVERVRHLGHGTRSLTARLEGTDTGRLRLVTDGRRTLVTVDTGELGRRYLIRQAPGSDDCQLLELAPHDGGRVATTDALVPPPLSPVEAAVRERIAVGIAATTSADLPAEIAVMIVYTPAAAAWAETNDSGIANAIAMALTIAQDVLDNSETGITLRLAHAAEVAYTESGSLAADLNLLRDTDDGRMDDVHAWRETHGADLVVLLAVDDDETGASYQLLNRAGRPDRAFSVCRVQQVSLTFNLVHELGHLLGCGHHADQDVEPGPGLFTYASGWRWTGDDDGHYCTVMTAEDGSLFKDGVNHARVPYFSNPSILFQGRPTGDALLADNARTLREIKHVIAGYVGSAGTPANLIYRLVERGTRRGPEAGTIDGSGYLVLDALSGESTVLLDYTDGTQLHERWDSAPAITHVVTGDGTAYQVLTNGARVDATVALPNGFDYAHLLGSLSGSEVHLGNDVRVRIPARLNGLRRMGVSADKDSVYGASELQARLDGRLTVAANGLGLGHSEAVGWLVTTAPSAAVVRPSRGVRSSSPVAASAGLALYSVTVDGIAVGAGETVRQRYPGFMVIDLASGDTQLLRVWREGGDWYYEIDDLTASDSIYYSLVVGRREYQFIGARRSIPVALDAEAELGFGFWLAYGQRRTIDIGGGLVADIAPVLSGSSWEHLAGQNPAYEQATFTAKVRGETRLLNDASLSPGAAMEWVIDYLLPAGAQPPPAPTGVARGLVRDGLNGAPLANAAIAIYSASSEELLASTTTGVNGEYVRTLPAGGLRVEISREGYVATVMLATAGANRETRFDVVRLAPLQVGNGTVTGQVIDALTGAGAPGITVSFRGGVNATAGPIAASATSDLDGIYTVELPSGTYTALATAAGYIPGHATVVAVGGATLANQHVTFSPELSGNELRLIVTWGASPLDLDAHLTGPLAAGGRFHVYYDVPGDTAAAPFAELAVDDFSAYGPETLTLAQTVPGLYRFSVHDFTNRNLSTSSRLADESDAVVTVLRGNRELARFNIPHGQTGTLWTVFELDGATGQITPSNNLSYVASPINVTIVPVPAWQ